MNKLTTLIMLNMFTTLTYANVKCDDISLRKIKERDLNSKSLILEMKSELRENIDNWKKTESSVLKKYNSDNFKQLQSRKIQKDDFVFMTDLAMVVTLRDIVVEHYLNISPCLDLFNTGIENWI